ncbi:MAG TPA: GNAT family N-acetyltransferase [Calditrichia bacterium]|nr:GNAT family N-acetyltransferase [Calditrichia bacterium]
MKIRKATAEDAQTLLELISSLAVYEKLSHTMVATAADILKYGFGENPVFHSVIAESESGEALGFALYFFKFSTFAGRPTLHLEDLYVREAHRSRGIGKALLLYLVEEAWQSDCGRMEWDVLDWNTPAITFYETLGAKRLSDWFTYRLDRDTLGQLSHSRRNR